MNEHLRIGVIGRIDASLSDGQTVKTRTLVSSLKEYYPGCTILLAESNDFKKSPLQVVKQVFLCVKNADVIFVLLSKHGRRILLPILFLLNSIYKKPVIHDCIGGAHAEILQNQPKLKKYYRKMAVNWVETGQLKEKLEQQGLTNVAVLPNFKNIHPIQKDAVTKVDTSPFHFCTFSRVNEAKGIGRAAAAILAINQAAGRNVAELHVYGPIEDSYDTVLNTYIAQANGAIEYRGVVDADDSVRVLKEYYALLFPTTFPGEGFPGTLIDAFSSGLPVIATDWHCNGEIISHGKTGFLYPADQPEQLKQWMEYAMEHPQEIHEMRFQCLEAVKQYSSETVMKTICKKIEELGG